MAQKISPRDRAGKFSLAVSAAFLFGFLGCGSSLLLGGRLAIERLGGGKQLLFVFHELRLLLGEELLFLCDLFQLGQDLLAQLPLGSGLGLGSGLRALETGFLLGASALLALELVQFDEETAILLDEGHQRHFSMALGGLHEELHERRGLGLVILHVQVIHALALGIEGDEARDLALIHASCDLVLGNVDLQATEEFQGDADVLILENDGLELVDLDPVLGAEQEKNGEVPRLLGLLDFFDGLEVVRTAEGFTGSRGGGGFPGWSDASRSGPTMATTPSAFCKGVVCGDQA